MPIKGTGQTVSLSISIERTHFLLDCFQVNNPSVTKSLKSILTYKIL